MIAGRWQRLLQTRRTNARFMPDDLGYPMLIAEPTCKSELGYPTQKPDALLERILRGVIRTKDLVLDCFCGSGTTAAVAEKLNRRWIACDLGRFAIHTTRKRLLGIPGVKPFVVQNLGKYERQQWQVAEFPSNGKRQARENREERETAYRKFILELYHATPVSGHVWLHGVKAGRMVHVGAVDAPVTRADVNAIAAEVWKASGKGPNSPQKPAVDMLGWEFALDINETAKASRRRSPSGCRLQENSPRSAGEKSGRTGRHPLLRAGRAHGGQQNQEARADADALRFCHPARRRARRSAQRHQALEPDGGLLGGGLGLQRRYFSQPVAVLPHAEESEAGAVGET